MFKIQKNNVFIVRTPLQAFNAVEANFRFCYKQNNYIIIIYRNNQDKKMIENIILLDDWFKIIFIKLKPQIKLFNLFFHLQSEINNIEFCFIGDHSTIISYYINRIKYKNLILLEDGTATIRRVELIEKRIFHIIKKTKYSKKSSFQVFFEKLFRVDIQYYYNARFFTIYNLNDKINFIKNDYRYFKKRINKLEIQESVFFIGSEIKNTILLNEKIFEKYIADIVTIYAQRNLEFYYILHRKESEEYIKLLSKKYNFKYLKFNNIIEIEFLNLNFIPSEISTFLSTAITTLSKLYPSNYKYYPLLQNDLNDKYKEPIKNLYIQFKKEGIETLERESR
jgi:hypothetical protein